MALEIEVNKPIHLSALATDGNGDIQDRVLFDLDTFLSIETLKIDGVDEFTDGILFKAAFSSDGSRVIYRTDSLQKGYKDESRYFVPPSFPFERLAAANEVIQNARGKKPLKQPTPSELKGAFDTIRQVFEPYWCLAADSQSPIEHLIQPGFVIPLHLTLKVPWGHFYNPGSVEHDGEKLQWWLTYGQWKALDEAQSYGTCVLLDRASIRSGIMTFRDVPLDLATRSKR